MSDAVILERSDGGKLVLHRLGPDTGPPLLISHATGFHGRSYIEIAEHLSRAWTVWAVDYRGHGVSPTPEQPIENWDGFAEDALCVAKHMAPNGGLRAFGHSMGGAAVLMAHLKNSGAFQHLVAFEPIAPPPSDNFDVDKLPIAVGAERRRPTFDSLDAAFDNYRSKPPLGAFTETSLRAYVDHGFERLEDGSATLRCTPNFEASVFRSAHRNSLWDNLAHIDLRVDVIAGVVEEHQPSNFAESVATRLPSGSYTQVPTMNHFGPFTAPAEVAAIVDEMFRSTTA